MTTRPDREAVASLLTSLPTGMSDFVFQFRAGMDFAPYFTTGTGIGGR